VKGEVFHVQWWQQLLSLLLVSSDYFVGLKRRPLLDELVRD
jgi:hypothetical protein